MRGSNGTAKIHVSGCCKDLSAQFWYTAWVYRLIRGKSDMWINLYVLLLRTQNVLHLKSVWY
jgi:hypothetical protein